MILQGKIAIITGGGSGVRRNPMFGFLSDYSGNHRLVMNTDADRNLTHHRELGNPVNPIQHPFTPMVMKQINWEFDTRTTDSLRLMRRLLREVHNHSGGNIKQHTLFGSR